MIMCVVLALISWAWLIAVRGRATTLDVPTVPTSERLREQYSNQLVARRVERLDFN